MIPIKTKSLSWKYYIPFYLIFISLFLFATRNYEQTQSSAVGLSNIHRIIGISVSFLLITVFFMKRGSFRKPPLLLLLYTLYVLIGYISAFLFSKWFNYSLWKLIEMTTVIFVGYYIWILAKNNKYIILIFYEQYILFIKFLLLTVLLSIFLMPNTSLSMASSVSEAYLPYRISGQIIIINSLSVGTFSSIVFFDTFIKILSGNKNYTSYFWLVFSLLFLILAQSRTSTLGLLIALLLFFINAKQIRAAIRYGILFLFTLPIIPMFPIITQYIARGASEETILSMSGRTIWWEFMWMKITNADLLNQLVGFGFTSGEREIASKVSNGMMQTLDSTYFSSLASTGFLGTSILIITFLFLIFKLFKLMRNKHNNIIYSQSLGLSIILFIKSLTTATLNVFTFYNILFIILILITYVKPMYRKGELK